MASPETWSSKVCAMWRPKLALIAEVCCYCKFGA